jgi:hypothetical protein
MDAETVGGIIGGAAGGASVALFVWLARRGRPQLDQQTGGLTFTYPRYLFWLFAGLAIVFPAFVAVMAVIHPPQDAFERFGVVALFLFVPVLSIPLLWELGRFRLILTPESLDCRPVWRSQRIVEWNDVESISFSNWLSWFVIRARDGWKFRIPVMVNALPVFLQACKAKLPIEALEAARSGYQRLNCQFPDRQLPERDQL